MVCAMKFVQLLVRNLIESIYLRDAVSLYHEGPACQKRWKQLVDRFTKERGVIAASGSGLADTVISWELFSSLKYLDQYIEKRSKKRILSADEPKALFPDAAELMVEAVDVDDGVLDPETGNYHEQFQY